MKKTTLTSYVLILILLLTSCQKDSFQSVNPEPSIYKQNLFNRLEFEFSQISNNTTQITPYNNTLKVKNTSSSNLSGAYVVYAFNDNTKTFQNLSFFKSETLSNLNVNDNSDVIELPTTDYLFTDENLIVAVLNIDSSTTNHVFNGFYEGEFNIFTPATDPQNPPVFDRSMSCVGYVDFQGNFNFLTQNNNEEEVVVVNGNLNSANLVTGHIFDETLSNEISLENIDGQTFSLNNNLLSGELSYTNNSQQFTLQFNLTKQN